MVRSTGPLACLLPTVQSAAAQTSSQLTPMFILAWPGHSCLCVVPWVLGRHTELPDPQAPVLLPHCCELRQVTQPLGAPVFPVAWGFWFCPPRNRCINQVDNSATHRQVTKCQLLLSFLPASICSLLAPQGLACMPPPLRSLPDFPSHKSSLRLSPILWPVFFFFQVGPILLYLISPVRQIP